MIEIKVPPVGESISEVTLVTWLKKDGEWVERDEVICELESEKATFELNAEKAGILHTVAEEGQDLKIGDLACTIDDEAARPEGAVAPAAQEAPKAPEAAPATPTAAPTSAPAAALPNDVKATPVAQAIIADKKIDPHTIKGTGSNGKIFKNDVLSALTANVGGLETDNTSREATPKKMSNLRRTISRRLVEAKNTTAMLTTFNEVDMTNIMAIRSQYKDKFKEKNGVGLGFMSFFTKACCIALEEWPAVNSYIDGDNIVSHNYVDISIAVSAPKGLVVPVIRNAHQLSLAGIEKAVLELAGKARNNTLTMEEMTGGTFTITNGGVFGSLMSTPIINIPQSAILGMHKIQERPMVVDGEIKIRPMMYLALSYDHRIIDGRESVGFLVRVKELLENPVKLLAGKDPIEILLNV